MSYLPDRNRYEAANFRRCGRSGLVLPPVSLGLWQNFGGTDVFETGRAVIRRAFDRGVTHFDLANNYDHLMVQRKRTSARSCARIFASIAMSS